MNEIQDWNDLRIFLAVARHGGLSRAVRQIGTSAPTLGRHVARLESSMGLSLFKRQPDGYALTPDGRIFLSMAEDVERNVVSIERWRAGRSSTQRVSIAAGHWTSLFLARALPQLAQGVPDTPIDILTGMSTLNLSRREATLGLRNQRPEQSGLAGRRLVTVAFAVYANDTLINQVAASEFPDFVSIVPWIVFRPDGPKTPSAIWLDQTVLNDPAYTCSSAEAVLSSSLAGAGFCVLPCFIGDATEGLMRASTPIRSLSHEQWLVRHDEDRHDSTIASVANSLANIIRGERQLFAGNRPRPVTD